MTHLLDTDHLTILQTRAGPDYALLVANMSNHPVSEVGASVVSLQEQALGANAKINGAKSRAALLQGYLHMFNVIESYRGLPLAPFDAAAAAEFDNLKATKIRVGTMDLRIAAIALANKFVLVTRNARDFAQVPGLALEDWTK